MSLYTKDVPSTIQSLFDSIALKYDYMNWIMSFGLHVLWNKKLVRYVFETITSSQTAQKENGHHCSKSYIGNNSGTIAIADLCCGTGEILIRLAHEFLRRKKDSILHNIELTGLDFSQKMLDVAYSNVAHKIQDKSHLFHISFQCHDVAQTLPFSTGALDVITMAYGIRNIKDRHSSIKEMHRVLKKGSCVYIIELTRPAMPFLKAAHLLYLKTCIPLFGKIFAKNKASYEYLQSSINNFIEPNKLAYEFLECGFLDVHIVPCMAGIATIFVATK